MKIKCKKRSTFLNNAWCTEDAHLVAAVCCCSGVLVRVELALHPDLSLSFCCNVGSQRPVLFTYIPHRDLKVSTCV